jgi:outer membrane protein, multidrug efflux system
VLDAAAGVALGEWWRRFEDPALDRLVERAVTANPDIRMQAARVEEARARLGLARAEQCRQSACRPRRRASASRPRRSASRASKVRPVTCTRSRACWVTSWTSGGAWPASARRPRPSCRATCFALEAVRLGVIADVAVVYFNLRSAERQLQITTQTIAAREEGVRIERLRFEAGQIDELNYRQAESELAGARAELPGRIEEISRLQSALGLLIGLEPAELLGVIELGDGSWTIWRCRRGSPPSCLRRCWCAGRTCARQRPN